MDSVETNRDEEEVILNCSSSTCKKMQSTQLIHHFFTFNNYDRDDIIILEKVFRELCYMYVFQEETGKNGTKHLQGIISLKKRMRWGEFNLMKAIHWEKPINVKDCYLYCCKEETRTGDVFAYNYEIPYRFRLKELYSWQHDIIRLISKPADDRSVNWYWSERGNVGKSSFVKHLVMNFNAILLTKGKYNDICNLIFKANMTCKNIVIFDLPRNNGNSISYDAIESIKNGMITNMKYETGFVCFPPPHVLVFANDMPEMDKLSLDRWNIVEL
ncbi:MAG: putative viral replication protein [Cressdnaviricota sp.]|nr:MAG: putative viral replication protein [Cressdnaviricota sp.]